MEFPLPLTRDLVLIGGGHAHALVLRMWGMNPLAGARLTVINPHPDAPYTGMLPGYLAGHYDRAELSIDLVKLARFAGASLVLDHAVTIDADAQIVGLSSGRELRFDTLSIDIGITTQSNEIAGFSEFGVAVKPMDVFAERWDVFRRSVLEKMARPDVCVIGGGIGGAEVAMAIAHGLRDVADRKITIIEQDKVLSREKPALAGRIREHLGRQGISIIENAKIAGIGADHVRLTDGQSIPSGFTIGSAGARAQKWLASTGLALNDDGFVSVNNTLQTLDYENIFAVGDCAHMTFSPRPKAGVFAVRAAPTLFHNLRAHLSDTPMRPFRPQRDYLKLVSLGAKSATAEKWGYAPSGSVLWQWKDRIDQKFMSQFQNLSPMVRGPLPKRHTRDLPEALGPKPLCGGCGAKLPASVLDVALRTAVGAKRDDILTAAGDDAAVLKWADGQKQVITTDHLRAFIADPVQMAKVTAHHALGDIWAMGARPQSAMVTLIMPPMSLKLQHNTTSEIMRTLSETLSLSGATIIGGHSSIGAEMTIGLTLTGLVEHPITLTGARAGDVLILTKPLGSGTIMAAEMQLEARGADVAECLDCMVQSQQKASEILSPHAHAMTDVTGFGLAGHATQMAVKSGVSITLDLAALPYMPGALGLASAGTRSSLFGANTSQAPHLLDQSDPRSILLFDPQTAGGLLASVAAENGAELVAALHRAGYEQAAIIGQVTDGQPGVFADQIAAAVSSQ